MLPRAPYRFRQMFGTGVPPWGRPLGGAFALIAIVAIGLDAPRYGLLWAFSLFLFQTFPSIVGSFVLTGWVISRFFPDTLLAGSGREDRRRALLTTVAVAAGSAIVVGGLFGVI